MLQTGFNRISYSTTCCPLIMGSKACEICEVGKFHRMQYGLKCCSKCKNAYYTIWLRVTQNIILNHRSALKDHANGTKIYEIFINEIIKACVCKHDDHGKIEVYCLAFCPACRFKRFIKCLTKLESQQYIELPSNVVIRFSKNGVNLLTDSTSIMRQILDDFKNRYDTGPNIGESNDRNCASSCQTVQISRQNSSNYQPSDSVLPGSKQSTPGSEGLSPRNCHFPPSVHVRFQLKNAKIRWPIFSDFFRFFLIFSKGCDFHLFQLQAYVRTWHNSTGQRHHQTRWAPKISPFQRYLSRKLESWFQPKLQGNEFVDECLTDVARGK